MFRNKAGTSGRIFANNLEGEIFGIAAIWIYLKRVILGELAQLPTSSPSDWENAVRVSAVSRFEIPTAYLSMFEIKHRESPDK